MVKTFLIDFPICIGLGLVFAFFKCDIERDDPFYRFASFWWGALGAAMMAFYAVVAYQFWPGWMWMYYFPPLAISPLGWLYVIFLGYGLPYIIGYLLGQHGRRQSWFVLFNSFVVVILAQYLGVSEFWERYSFLREENVAIFDSRRWLSLFALGSIGLVIYTIGCWWVARRYYLLALESGKIVKHMLHPGKRRTLQTLAEAMLPDAPDLRKVSARDMPLADMFSRELADMNFLNRTAIRFFIDYLNSAPFVYKGIPFRFEFLPQSKQVEILDKMAHSESITAKMPLVVVRMFLLQQYYQDQRVLDELGYVGESLGVYREPVRWMNVPEYKETERNAIWSALSRTMGKISR